MIPGRDNAAMQINTILNTSAANLAGFVPWGIIRAQGVDTVKFLQGQLTQDVALMGLDEARLAAWCSAKGRMLASFVVVKNSAEDILLLCSADVLPATLKRLQMFVMRAQCKLTDASAAFVLRGLAGDAVLAPAVLGTTSNATDSIASRATSTLANGLLVSRNGNEVTVQLPAGHHHGAVVPRALQLVPVLAESALTQANTQALSDADTDALAHWQYLEVTSGIARITLPVVEAFVPQMLNYESVGGVNFKKGCYPGQEVVARSQFRSTLKRRAFVVLADAAMPVGSEVFHSGDFEQPCGTVVASAAVPGGVTGSAEGSEAGGEAGYATGWAGAFAGVVSMQVAAAEGGSLHLGGVGSGVGNQLGNGAGPVLHLQTLPYALLADI